MSVVIDVKPLREATAKLARTVERRNTIPIVGMVRIVSGEDIATLTATDLDIELRIEVAATVEAPLDLCINAVDLAAFAKRVADGGQIRIAGEEGAARLTCGRARAKLPTLPGDDFPMMEMVDGTAQEIGAASLARLMAFCTHAISTEETRYYLNGVFLHCHAGRLRGVATDGHQLTLHDGPACDDFPGVIVPRKSVTFLSALTREDTVAVTITETKLRLEYDGLRYTTKVIDGTFPDYTRVIPQQRKPGQGGRITLDSAALASAIPLVLVGVDDKARAVRIVPEGNAIAVSAHKLGYGGEAEIDGAVDDQPEAVGMNSIYISACLAAFGDGALSFDITGAGAPVRITRDDDPDRLAVIMPMRI